MGLHKFIDGKDVLCLGLCHNGQSLAVGGNANAVVIYRLSYSSSEVSLVERTRLQAQGVTLSLALNADATVLATGGDARIVEVWGTSPGSTDFDGEPHARFSCKSTVHSVSLTDLGDLLAVGTSEFTELYEVESGGAMKAHQGNSRTSKSVSEVKLACSPLFYLNEPVHQGGISLSANGDFIAIAANANVTVYSIVAGGTIRRFRRDGRARSVALSARAEFVVAGGFDKKLTLHKVHGGSEMHEFRSGECALVRSVHLSADSSRLALGGEGGSTGQLGLVELYDADSNERLAVWQHSKAVWSVRLSSNGQMLAAAGYDMSLTLYDTLSQSVLHQIKYKANAGPAFIWCVDFSADDEWLAVGCWSGEAFLYKVDNANDALWPGALDQVASVSSDEPAAPTQSPPARDVTRGSGLKGAEEESRQQQDFLVEAARVRRTDRVYCVAISHNGRRMAVGGRDKMVAMYDTTECCDELVGWRESREAGEPEAQLLWEVAAEDFVYTMAVSQDLQFCVFGGVSKMVHVLDGRMGRLLFKVPTAATVWTVALLADSSKLAFGGEASTVTVVDTASRETWLQLPVQDTVYEISLSPLSLCFSHGDHGVIFGKGGAHYSWQDQPSTAVIQSFIVSLLSTEDKLLECLSYFIAHHPAIVNSSVSTGHKQSLLQFIVQSVSFQSVLELCLDSEIKAGLQPDVYGRTALDTALEQGKWRSLHLLLDAIVERKFMVVPRSMKGVTASFDTMAQKFPRDFLRFIRNMPLQAEPEVLDGEITHDVMLQHFMVVGSNSRAPKGIWKKALLQHRVSLESDDDDSHARTAMDSSLNRKNNPFNSSNNVTEGFSKATQGSIEALRVPFENFAGYVESSTGVPVSPLQLIVSAAVSTHDFTVFGSRPVEILLEFKWNAFARFSFLVETALFSLHVAIAAFYSLSIADNIGTPAREIFGIEEGTSPNYRLIIGSFWTSIYSLIKLVGEIKQLRVTAATDLNLQQAAV